MKCTSLLIILSFACSVAVQTPSFAAAPTANEAVPGLLPSSRISPSVDKIVARSLETFYYAGEDQRTRVSMRLINSQGKERKRVMTLLRKDLGTSGEQRYYIYFHEPSDVKGTAFMVWKYPAREDDRWIFIPAIKLVRRIAADDKRSSFVGSDFTYEDVSGRDLEDETHNLLGEETLGGRPVFKIESAPQAKVEYVRRLSWIDRERGLPLKEEYYDARGELLRTFSADEVREVDGHWTATRRTMHDAQSGHRTEVVFDEVNYDVGLGEDLFSERYLRRPPGQWVR
ncbi:outer membrane lipoprotein-sorting protein [Sedimenticola selenatireducens]|uniref:outer membrane lipoprotein-sorting protein n=1 Tax=Sedimenticola selenatireducens TaxID=191960 RepID=UPI0006855E6B|nr:outer membrane lipoprotein-sorting protein [Sedimenticola selenatireducens]